MPWALDNYFVHIFAHKLPLRMDEIRSAGSAHLEGTLSRLS
jgi:hypothetical protein